SQLPGVVFVLGGRVPAIPHLVAWRHRGRRARVMMQGLHQFAICRAGQADGAPFGTADAHVPFILVDFHRSQQIAPATARPQILGVGRQLHARQDVIAEDEQALIAGAPQIDPALQTVDVAARGPALPDAALFAGASGRETTALHVNHETRTILAEDDKVQALDWGFAEDRTARLIDGDVTETVSLQVRLKRRLVVVAAI